MKWSWDLQSSARRRKDDKDLELFTFPFQYACPEMASHFPAGFHPSNYLSF